MPVLSPELRVEAERIKARYPAGRERSAILPLLYLVQSVEGRVTREGLREVADLLGLTTAETEAVATFYTMIRVRPTGRHVITVCTNLSCALRGAGEVYERGRAMLGLTGEADTTEDGAFTLDEEECLGACDAAPVVTVNFANFDRVSPEGIDELIATLRDGGTPTPARGEFPGDFRSASRILAGVAADPAAAATPSAEARSSDVASGGSR
jgi:NADH-quinone oxidoreductase subunit E